MKKGLIGLFVSTLLLMGLTPLFAQNNPVEWYSPRLMSLGAATAGTESPMFDALNPSASAGNQRTTIELSYFLIAGTGTAAGDESGIAHWLNAGISIPSQVGVFSLNGHFATSPFINELAFGTFGGGNFSFAKDISDTLWVGIGLGFEYGTARNPTNPVAGSERDDWGLGLSVGFTNLVNDAGFLKDFRWGAAIRDIGKGMFTPYGAIGPEYLSNYAIPPNFTPAIGTQFKLIKTDDVSLGFNADLAFPTVQNVQFNAGIDFELFRRVAIQVSYDFDLNKLIHNVDRPIPLSFGASFRIGGDSKDTVDENGQPLPFWRTSELRPSISVTPISKGIMAFGIGANLPIGVIDKTPPVLIIGDPEFDDEPAQDTSGQGSAGVGAGSPAAGSNTQTSADPTKHSSIPLAELIASLPSETTWSESAFDSNPGNAQRVFAVSASMLPGLTMGGGAGEKSGTTGGSGQNKAVTAGAADRVTYISPNFNGIKDTLSIPISVKDERSIASYALIVSKADGTVVRTIRNKEERPETKDLGSFWEQLTRVKTGLNVPRLLVWDGRGDDGNVVPDGDYSYVIEVADDNGNTVKSSPRAVVVDTKAPDIQLQAPGDRGFAPGGDRPFFVMGQTSTPEDKWAATIIDSDGKIVRNFSWENTLPPTFDWDGKNDSGTLAKDGVYSFKITSTDRAGNTGTADLDNILLLNQPTPVRLSIDNAWFSPNNDNIKDTVTVNIDANAEVQVENWTAVLKDSKGAAARTYSGTGALPRTLTIDGMDANGKRLPEGPYALTLSALYVNGNKPSVDAPMVNLDITPPSATLSADYSVFSPNGDGKKDAVTITQKGSQEVAWKAAIRPNGGSNTLVEFNWRVSPDQSLVWDGKDSSNKVLPDGVYTYQLSATDLAGNFGQSSPLVVQIDNRPTSLTAQVQRAYFSPNGDNVADTQTIDLSYPLVDGISDYEVRVIALGSDASAVFGSAQPVFTWKGSGRPASSFVWDGKNSSGQKAPDGSYQVEASLTYVKGDNPVTTTRGFVLDTVAPTVNVSVLNPTPLANGRVIFSPDGDGSQDTLSFVQQTSDEQNWTGRLYDAKGAAVRTVTWQGKAPAQFVWDGADSNGNHVSDGDYSYTLESTDQAGNTAKKTITSIQVDTKPTTVAIAVGSAAFSPNGDGVKDSMEFLPKLDQNSDIKTWTLKINPAAGGSARTVTGQDHVPTKLLWDGKTDGGRLAPEGDYLAILSVEYLKGSTASSQSPRFALDTTAPAATAYPDLTLFSPDGDGLKDKVTINQDGSSEAQWNATIRFANPPSGTTDPVVANYAWAGKPAKTQVWDGTNTQGITVPDGAYTYQLTATDLAGNSGSSAPVTINVDKRVVSVGVKADQRWVSPNGDGRFDKLTFSPTIALTDGIDNWQLDILASTGNIASGNLGPTLPAALRSIKGSGRIPASIEWDGKTDSGAVAQDADYRAVFTVTYLKGNRPRALSEVFTVDTTAPKLSLSGENLLFSPDGDGLKDAARIKQQSSPEDLWEGYIVDANNKTVRSYVWRGQTQDANWDGRDDNGNLVADGRYSYVARATDKAGNTTEQRLTGIVIDTRPTPVLLTASARGFAPGTGRSDVATISFRPLVTLRDGVSSWALNFVLQNGKVEYSMSGQGLPPDNIQWDGNKPSDGAPATASSPANKVRATEGRYEAVLVVEYAKGNKPEARSSPFQLDVSAPNAVLNLTPQPFSPDDDGVDDEVTIGLQVDDPSPIKDWELAIYEPVADATASGKPVKPFVTFNGQGQPAGKIVWNGKSGTGELVQAAEDYRVVLTISDTLGNKGSYDAVISTDVLVIRDGDVLRIRIPGIEFPANSANLAAVTPDKAAKNNKTLDRLAEILRRYSSYAITVEGHANITQYWDPKLADDENKKELIPLSEKRADAVRAALTQRGIALSRMSIIGVGGTRPIVPNKDLDNVWKNRRVEFILKK